MKEEIKNPETSVEYTMWKKKCEKTCEKNGVETIVDSDGILWLNEKNIEQGLDHKNLRDITIKYHSDHRRHRY